MRKIGIFSEGITFPYKKISKKKIKSDTNSILEILTLDNVSVTIIGTDNPYMKELNRTYRKKNSPTDVISFANRDEPFPSAGVPIEELGDIYISLEKAEEQAVVFGVTLYEEVRRLLVHGLLHLLGFDHERSVKDARLMEKKENEIIHLLQSISNELH